MEMSKNAQQCFRSLSCKEAIFFEVNVGAKARNQDISDVERLINLTIHID